MSDPTAGQLAYEEHRAEMQRTGLIESIPIPLWDELPERDQQSWHIAALRRDQKREGCPLCDQWFSGFSSLVIIERPDRIVYEEIGHCMRCSRMWTLGYGVIHREAKAMAESAS